MYISSTSTWPVTSTYSTQNSSSSSASSSDTQVSQTATHKHKTKSVMDSDAMQAFFNGTTSQGLVPMTDTNSSDDSGISSFLEKVKNGTVTASDLSSMQEALSKTPTQSQPTQSSTASASAAETSATTDSKLSIKDFLDKVKAGTVIDSDLSTMQNELSAMQGAFGTMPPPSPNSMSDRSSQENNSSSIKAITSFLDKVKSGTVTASDLSSLQALLNSDSTQSSTTSASTDSQLSIKDFLDKVKTGTVTDSDLSTMSSELNLGLGESGTRPPVMKGGLGLVSQQLLDTALQSYDNNASNSDWNRAKNNYTT